MNKAEVRERGDEAMSGLSGQGAVEPGGEAAFALDAFLPYRLSHVANRVSRAFARRYSAEFGLSIPEWRVLAVLGSFAPISSNEIVARTAMDKAKVSRAVGLLAGKAMISRRAHPTDQRLIRLEFTDKGRAAYEAIVPLARELEARLPDGLAPGERAEQERLLCKLERRLDDDPAG